ncbi:MAG: glutamine-hydrolyzing carbamoyl-phosphate synthase small subunit [Oscillospiraceae bacterium]|nr:glutamine-hydrolyzing carbamoyl-phosphate synthase small subunit [Oscillospiraceae bacterium]
MDKKVYLILSDGTVFEGYRFGADVDTVGELVFTTGMNGYIETLTDESYYGQIVLQTFPMIGNYGIISGDFEGKCSVKGYVVREWCEQPSNFRSEGTVDGFLKKNGVPGIYGIDTRAVTKIIREHGVMNAMISDKIPEDLTELKNYAITSAVMSVTGREPRIFKAENEKFKVTLMDYGAKKNITRELLKRNCTVTVLPADSDAETILKTDPDGIMLSNGPGDPAENEFQIEQLKKLVGKIPICGICLGHQLLALAMGGQTVKLKYGHRGVNQPVKDVSEGRTYITSQNHGYAVVSESIKDGRIRFVNANDGTCEGIDYPELSAFSVQFHPEACSGPKDTAFLFDRFINLMEGK